MVNITTLLLASAVAIASVEAASAGQGKCMIQGGKLKRFYPRDGELVPASGKYTVCKKKNFVASKPVTSESKAVEQITTEAKATPTATPAEEKKPVYEEPKPQPKPIETPKPQPKPIETPKPQPKPQPTPTPAPAPSGDFQSDCLSTHNRLRAQDGKSSLSWSSALASHAQNWANHLASIDQGTFNLVHSGGPYGENLYVGGRAASDEQTCSEAVQSWYDEKKLFASGQRIGDGDFHAYGHYSQLVWGTTTKLGCARGERNFGDRKHSYIVCEYDPRGNVIGQQIP